MKINFRTRQAARNFAQKRTASGIPTSVKDAGVEMKAQGKSRYFVTLRAPLATLQASPVSLNNNK